MSVTEPEPQYELIGYREEPDDAESLAFEKFLRDAQERNCPAETARILGIIRGATCASDSP